MNYFVYYVAGADAFNYLGETNYVGVWAESIFHANDIVSQYFKLGTQIVSVKRNQVKGKIGYLY